MKPKTEKILMALKVLSCLALIGYTVNFGSQLLSFIVSINNPVASNGIPGIGADLLALRKYNFQFYVYVMSFVLVSSAMFASLWYQAMQLLMKINVSNPFTMDVSGRLDKIAYWLFSIWVVGLVGRIYIDTLSKRMGEHLNIDMEGNEFLFNAGIVFIVSQIFRHGIEIQEENQQTI